MKDIHKFLILVLFLLSVLSGIIIGVVIALMLKFNIQNIKINPADAISIANTYIVFISIFFILFTIAITIASFIFSKIFFTEKVKEIHQNIVIISKELKNDENVRSLFFDEIFKEGPILDTITEKIIEVIEEIKKDTIEEKKEIEDIKEIKERLKQIKEQLKGKK